jgi:choline dehydrogenase
MARCLSLSFLLPLLQLSLVLASPNENAPFSKRAMPFGVTVHTDGIEEQTFDYIVVGGGLAGMTVASRLSENSGVTVLMIEAGRDDRTNSLVFDMYKYGQAFNTDLNWNWPADGQHISG